MLHTTTAAPVASEPRATLPRLLLLADGLVVVAGGAALLTAARPLASVLGLRSAQPLAALGAAFVPYGTGVLWAAGRLREPGLRRLLGAVTSANAAWVALSAILLLLDRPALTVSGRRAVAAVAAVVALFAAAEAFALRRTD
jgi:hypothetical protein